MGGRLSLLNYRRVYGIFTVFVVIVIFVWHRQAISTIVAAPESVPEIYADAFSEELDGIKINNPTKLPYGKVNVVYGKTLEDVSNPHYGDNIFYSIKTTSQRQYYRERILVLMLTWFQAVKKSKLSIVTDKHSPSKSIDEDVKFIKEEGFRLLTSDCPLSHELVDLCCKSTAEYRAYYRELEQHEHEREKYEWFCHFDDDVYVNVRALSNMLSNYDPSEPLYIGRWDRESWGGPMSEEHYVGFTKKERENIKRLNQTIKQEKFWYANGCGYCVSQAAMMEAKHYFTISGVPVYGGYKNLKYKGPEVNLYGNLSFCNYTWTPDDVSVAVIFTAFLGHKLTNIDEMHSQRENLSTATLKETKRYITISSNKLVNLNSPFSNDEYKFIALHCLLYPYVTWCEGHRITPLHV